MNCPHSSDSAACITHRREEFLRTRPTWEPSPCENCHEGRRHEDEAAATRPQEVIVTKLDYYRAYNKMRRYTRCTRCERPFKKPIHNSICSRCNRERRAQKDKQIAVGG